MKNIKLMLEMAEDRNKEMFYKGAEKGYICTCCKDETSLYNSVSFRGSNLVCYPCVYKMERTLGFTVGEIVSLIQNEGRKKRFKS